MNRSPSHRALANEAELGHKLSVIAHAWGLAFDVFDSGHLGTVEEQLRQFAQAGQLFRAGTQRPVVLPLA